MHIRDRVMIKTSPEQVWSAICDMELVPLWNEKAKDVVIVSSGAPRPGYKYRMTYVLGKNRTEVRAEIVKYEKPLRLVIRAEEKNLDALQTTERWFEEVYILTKKHNGTLLEQKITVHNSGINIFFRCVIWLLMKFGKPTAKKTLEELRDLIET